MTQIALGAAVGEAVVGRKAGGRGAAWGAVLGLSGLLEQHIYHRPPVWIRLKGLD